MNNIEIYKKLCAFLNEKMRKIYDETKDDKHKLDFKFIETKGFKKSVMGHGYDFSNRSGCICELRFKGKNKRKLIYIEIDKYSSNGWYGTVGMLYRCLDEIDVIAEEFHKLKNELIKQEKIDEIANKSIKTWLKTVLENQPYSYYTTVSENKIMLSIKMKNRMQLDIPIYYRNFQKIMPDLLKTIQQFENTVNDSKVKVLISNSQPNQQWKTPK